MIFSHIAPRERAIRIKRVEIRVIKAGIHPPIYPKRGRGLHIMPRPIVPGERAVRVKRVEIRVI